MTQKLYFLDPWMKDFEAKVTGLNRDDSGQWLSLDRSAFYPEGGGQPWDEGILTYRDWCFPVAEVQADEAGFVWHRVTLPDGATLPQAGEAVRGYIDWQRRFDHMQQHTGEHILANCLHRLTGGFTHGLHIGADVSSIDVTLPDGALRLPPEALDEIEALANRRVAEDAPIDCFFPTGEELAALPLRKEPTVTEMVRVCKVGDFEMVACGGTHLSRTSQAGLVKILSCQPARGRMRLFFLCGLRAAGHYRMSWKAIDLAASLLSVRPDEVPARVSGLQDQVAEGRKALSGLRRELTLAKAPGLMAKAQPLTGGRLICAELMEEDIPAMEDLARALIGESGVLALLCAPQGDKTYCLFARSPDRNEDMAALLKASGAKGGGRPGFARGQAGGSVVLEQAAFLLPRG
jgi:alanyl-tRNA synthetase